MKLESQVTSLALSQRLRELCGPLSTIWTWYVDESRDDVPALNLSEPLRVVGGVGYFTKTYPAPTVAELGEMIPKEGKPFITDRNRVPVDIRVTLRDGQHSFDAETEADARARFLIHLIEQGLVKPEALRP